MRQVHRNTTHSVSHADVKTLESTTLEACEKLWKWFSQMQLATGVVPQAILDTYEPWNITETHNNKVLAEKAK